MSDKDIMEASRQMAGMHVIAKEIEIARLRALLLRWYDTYSGSTMGRPQKPVDAGLDAETKKELRL